MAQTYMRMKQVVLYTSFLLCFMHLIIFVASEEDSQNVLSPFLGKKYELASSDDKFDKVLETLGMSAFKRGLAQIAQPAIELSRLDDGQFVLKTYTIFNMFETRFRLGEEFHEETPDGREVRSKFVQDKNLLLQTERGNKTLYVLREFSADEVVVTMTVDSISCVRIFKLKK